VNATPVNAAAELEPRTDTGNGPLQVGAEFIEAARGQLRHQAARGRARFLEPGKHTGAGP